MSFATPHRFAIATPSKPAYVLEPSGATVTYRDLDDQSLRLARFLRARGLRPGDVLAIFMENHPSYLVANWAARRSGLYYTCVNSHLHAPVLDYILRDSGAKALVTSFGQREVVEQLFDLSPQLVCLMADGTIPGFESLEDVASERWTNVDLEELPGSEMLYSGGTTGRPKGVRTRYAAGVIENIGTTMSVTPDDVFLSPTPLYHGLGNRCNLAMTALGATAVIMEHWDPRLCLELIERHRATISAMVPTTFVRMLKLPESERLAYDVTSLRAITTSGAPFAVETKEQAIEWFGPIINEAYGSTEGNGMTFCTADEWLTRKGTVGRAALGVIHIADESGRELGPLEVGTVYFSDGPDFEYHNDPDKTARARNDLGWTTVGDIGYLDEDGYLFLTDRAAFMTVVGGVNVYPQEAENALVMHPKVRDVAVFGVPSAEMGEEVKAVVEPMDWSDAGSELEAELIDYCRSALAHIKCPRTVDFVDRLPRDETGKLAKASVRDRYWSGRPRRIN
jgi:acyl-CoA synthetase (AMP-forming)/AMP-acid ligase II